MKRDSLRLSPHQSIETGRDWNGRYFIAYSGSASMFFRDTKDLRRFMKLPAGIPSRASFDSWIASLAATDAERTNAAADGLSAEHVATGFGPECHGIDATDPNHNTRTVI